tara:strand:+ start:1553 stop:1861 length:309 start_codon:yes stop_codon:yes gene_type:complete
MKQDWFFVGFVKDDEYNHATQIAESYKCKIKGDFYSDKALFVDNSFRVSSIRNKLWGHRWATSCDWLAENPDLASFDPNVKIKTTPRKTRGTVKVIKPKTKS